MGWAALVSPRPDRRNFREAFGGKFSSCGGDGGGKMKSPRICYLDPASMVTATGIARIYSASADWGCAYRVIFFVRTKSCKRLLNV